MKTIEEFYNEAMADKALEEAASKAHKENRLAEFLTEHGVDGTAEEFEALVKEKILNRCELSDEKLEQASGGFDNTPYSGEWEYGGYVYDINELVFEFAVGETVFVWEQFVGKIEAREIQQDFDRAYPAYYVRLDDGSARWYGQTCLSHTEVEFNGSVFGL